MTTKRKAKPEDDVPKVTLIMGTSSKRLRRMTIPASWKVTFGAVCPGSKYSGSPGPQGWCLRVYEAAEKPRAIFTDVTWFRTEDIPVTERETRQRTKHMRGEGVNQDRSYTATMREHVWIDPLDPEPDESVESDEDFLQLTEGEY